MKTVMKVTNFIRSTNNVFTPKKFKNFLQEISATYEGPSLHTDIRWLNSANSLSRFFSLRNEVGEFLKNEIKRVRIYCINFKIFRF